MLLLSAFTVKLVYYFTWYNICGKHGRLRHNTDIIIYDDNLYYYSYYYFTNIDASNCRLEFDVETI